MDQKSGQQSDSSSAANQTNPQNNSCEVDLTSKLKKAEEEATKKDNGDKAMFEETEKLRQELNQMTELAKRTMADLENYRRRQESEKQSWFLTANTELIKAILPILENFERAKQHTPDAAKDWAEGINICINQLHKALEDFGVKPIEAIGKPFNPEFHDALLQGHGEKNLVLEELEKGYTLGDKVIRHSKVKVGNGEKEA